VCTSIELSNPLTPPTLIAYVDFAYKHFGFHVDSFPQPFSPCPVDPMDCTVLCSSIMDSTLVVNEDQIVDRVDVVQPTYVIIHDECVRESKE